MKISHKSNRIQKLRILSMASCALLVPVFPLFAITSVNPAASAEKITALASRVQMQFAPDKRSAVFQVTWNESSSAITVESTEPAAIAEFQRQLQQENIAIVATPRLLPAKELNGRIYGVANLSVCNNRVAPANAAEMATQMLLGTPVEVLKKERGYYLVRTPDKYIAWTDDDGISLMDAPAFEAWKLSPKVVFTVDYGHAFSQPSTKSLRVSDLVHGNILQFVQKQGDFLKVRFPDGHIAYVPTRQTTPGNVWLARKNPQAKDVIASAKTLMGVPYLWGGTSIKGVDCSGLTKTAFFLNGVILPRDASQQALVGESIDITDKDAVSIEKCLKNLAPGDLLFFGSSRQPGETPRISHTALYLGQGEFIQALGQVRISSLLFNSPGYDEKRTKSLLSARRILNSVGTQGIVRADHHALY